MGGSAAGTFASKNVALDGVTVTGITIGGTDAPNYNLVQQTGLSASISKANLSVTANAGNKTYDGLAYSGGNGVTYTGLLKGETSSVLAGTLGYSGTFKGAITGGSYIITPQGLSNSNYTMNYCDESLIITGAPPPSPSNNLIVSNMIADITSIQNHVNGTQDQADKRTGSSNPGIANMGPGVGSGIFEGNDLGGLISDRTRYLTDEERRNRR